MHLLVIFGPPAVGKMTIGRRVVERSGFRLFHNHALIEPLLEVFDYGTPPFVRLLREMRQQVVEEAAASGTDLVLTYVWGLELEGDVEELSQQIAAYVERGAVVSFVELAADLQTRLERNRTEHRLAEKRSKRDLDWSDSNVRDMERYVMNTDAEPGGEGSPGLASAEPAPSFQVGHQSVDPRAVRRPHRGMAHRVYRRPVAAHVLTGPYREREAGESRDDAAPPSCR